MGGAEGPSTNPKDKRMGCPTEDDLMDDEDSEGVIPKGEALVRAVICSGRGTYTSAPATWRRPRAWPLLSSSLERRM